MAPRPTKAKKTQQPRDCRCPRCGELFTESGIWRHERVCAVENADTDRADMVEAAAMVNNVLNNGTYMSSMPPVLALTRPGDREANTEANASMPSEDAEEAPTWTAEALAAFIADQRGFVGSETPPYENLPPPPVDELPPPLPLADPETVQPSVDDIKIEYHPNSQRCAETIPLHRLVRERDRKPPDPPLESKPWEKGFHTRLDFEVAAFALEAQLNNDQSASLLKLLKRAAEHPEELTVRAPKDLSDGWDLMEKTAKIPKFVTEKVTATFNGHTEEYAMYSTDVWAWVRSIITDPALAPFLAWDAQEISKFDGAEWERILDEPWTGDRWSKIQDQLPNSPDAKAVCLVAYADTAKLSGFGTAEAHPVFMEIANLPANIRHSDRWGGAILVGWLPYIKEDSDKSGKKWFINLKTVIWHNSMGKLLKDIENHAKNGVHIECGDGIIRWLFLCILILAADYEEQYELFLDPYVESGLLKSRCVMALIRGTNCKFPCPRCMVPQEEQSATVTARRHPVRTTESMEKAVVEAHAARTLEEGESILKENGLRKVVNAFWQIERSDPYDALSFDTLHSSASGLWGGHMFEVIKEHIEELGRSAVERVDKCMNMMPSWRGLTHFESVMNIAFNDGTKYADMLKQFVFAAHVVLTPESSPAGYRLLCAIARYVLVYMFMTLDVNTDRRVAKGRECLAKFEEAIQAYIKYVEHDDVYGDKTWNFPKIHQHAHVFDDIEAKGAARNFGTKPFEKMHGRLRKIYKNQTNFKNFEEQIVRIRHRQYMAQDVQEQLERLDALQRDEEQRRKDEEVEDARRWRWKPSPSAPSDDDGPSGKDDFQRIVLGSPDGMVSLEDLEGFVFGDGQVFPHLRREISTYLGVKLTKHDLIRPYKYLEVKYSSEVDWTITADYLRCNSDFHNKPRFDFVLLRVGSNEDNESAGIVVAQVLYIFGCTIDGIEHPLMITLPLDAPTGTTLRKDRDLGFIRRRMRQRRAQAKVEIFSPHSIIRGAVVTKDFAKDDDYLLVNSADHDLLLRTFDWIPS
ncbi:uncharacterized protein SCHCODRAFT_02682721 [Schizophyllum commune H4-8]|nr:uncharacterized protein SCHCODRAFT_02682721 [Schizophyllum commune H4-8]KAI5899758.1 hypothetical protein SCHCODRAFT_02682721 [Schizophyllum commune H4-8]